MLILVLIVMLVSLWCVILLVRIVAGTSSVFVFALELALVLNTSSSTSTSPS